MTMWRGGPVWLLGWGIAAAKVFKIKYANINDVYKEITVQNNFPRLLETISMHNPTYLYPVYENVSKKGRETFIIDKPKLMRPHSNNWISKHLQTACISSSGENVDEPNSIPFTNP